MQEENQSIEPKYRARIMLNTIFYVMRACFAWHLLLSGDFSSWQIVYSQFQSWQRSGII